MNTKTIYLYVPLNSKRLPLKIYEGTSSSSLSPILEFNFSNSFTVNITGSIVLNNLVDNPGFEYPEASGSTIQDWTPEYPYWSRLVSGSYSFGERFASSSMVLNDVPRGITSPDFSVTEDLYYKVYLSLKSENGKIYYTNPNTGISGREDVLAKYYGYMLWKSSSSALLFSGSGKTVEGSDITTYTSSLYEDLYIPESWKVYKNILQAPTGCTTGSFVIYAYYEKPTTYDSSYYGDIIKAPAVYLDNASVFLQQAAISACPTIAFDFNGEYIGAIVPSASTVVYSDIFSSGSSDCYGESATDTFDDDGNNLYAGHSDTNENMYRSWIPFDITFSSASMGIYVDSATLELTASQSKAYISENPTKLSIGFEDTINPNDPTTSSDLYAKSINESPLNTTIAQTWIEGTTYTFDITNSAKALFGTNGITWTNGSTAAIIVKNWGSAMGAYQTFASEENPYYTEPKLTINYANNYYEADVYDLTIKTDSPYVDRTIIDVGVDDSNINRALMFFDCSSIPSGATIMDSSASLLLFQNTKFSTGSANLFAYPLLKKFDYYTGTWYKQYGTKNWTTAGAGEDSDDVDFSSGCVAASGLAFDRPNGWIDIPFDTDTAQDWITTPTSNNGIMLKMEDEVLAFPTTHRFTSSQNTNESARPYLHLWCDVSGTPTEYMIRSGESGNIEVPTTYNQINRIFVDNNTTTSGGAFVPPGTSRYLLFFRLGNESNTPTFNGETMTKIEELVSSTVGQQAWGLVIPDAWASETYYFTNSSRGELYIFENVNSETPILDHDSISHSSTNNSSINITSNAYGQIYDMIRIYNSTDTVYPECGDSQIRLWVKPDARALSKYAEPIDGTVTMSWTHDTLRDSQLVISLNPSTS